MVDVIASAIATLTMLLAVVCNPPARATCPLGWWLSMGVRRSGAYVCTRVPVGDDVRGADGLVRDHSVVPAGEIDGRIYCTNGQEPIVVDARTVGCQQRH